MRSAAGLPAAAARGEGRVPVSAQQIDALLRRHERDDRRLQWLLAAMVALTFGLVLLAWVGPIVG
jgi:hypothetical protein